MFTDPVRRKTGAAPLGVVLAVALGVATSSARGHDLAAGAAQPTPAPVADTLRVSGLLGTSKSSFKNPIQTTITFDRANQDGWTYDALTRYVRFHGDSIPPRDSVIVVKYTVDPGYVAPST